MTATTAAQSKMLVETMLASIPEVIRDLKRDTGYTDLVVTFFVAKDGKSARRYVRTREHTLEAIKNNLPSMSATREMLSQLAAPHMVWVMVINGPEVIVFEWELTNGVGVLN